ncbi:MAG: type IV secretion system protein [Pseudomonadota bacterium]|nr:type IV secretion system protein [Gammaproteobacteria bacterium]MBU1558590.1 type IV secretion system protein [Gammaproteobacteria bacterium]MBU1629184.1 type IV secretion system protein [Gammaproteobacteria bacterium]MBU1927079.1 type IV secretion system protein [Gammaproteobacteria bacterium]MBU2546535.1 type IV secretion system protein [Gammaproteobacteria bacterium]
MNKPMTEYFECANSWADDLYTEAVVSRNRYQFAFFWISGLASLLVISLIVLLPLRRTELVIVHQFNDGTVWVEPGHQKAAPHNKQAVESEIVRYVVNRESFSVDSYNERYSLITLLSSARVAQEYAEQQAIQNKQSPINRLGRHTVRKVQVDNVVFLDNEGFQKDAHQVHHNLVQVDFRITDHNTQTGQSKTKSMTALISWVHRGTPKNPEDKWRNWDGFVVTRYETEQRNV